MLIKTIKTVVAAKDILFTDLETEGKKRGYQKAAKEYEPTFIDIEQEYKNTLKSFSYQKNDHVVIAQKLINILEQLEQDIDDKIKKISKKYNIPIEKINLSVQSNATLAGGGLLGLFILNDVLNAICDYKEKKLREAEQAGYLEAKALFEEKISKMKQQFKPQKNETEKHFQKLNTLIKDALDEIIVARTKIAELNILLEA